MPERTLGALLLGSCAVAVLGFVYFLGAYRAARGAPLVRRLELALIVGAVALAPLLTAMGAAVVRHPADPDPSTFALGVLLSVIAWAWMTRFLPAPGRAPRTLSGGLPLLTDPVVLGRVRDLAGRMGIAPPRVLLLGSTGGAQVTQAYAGGLANPTLILSDGALHRLADDERDAILGHELAHLSTGTLWLLAMSPVVAAELAALVLAVDPVVALVFFPAALVGIRRILQRRVEVLCDRAAARVVGFPAMSRALEKIHAAQQLPKGLRARLFYAMASHPDGTLRRAALAAAAPETERHGITAALDTRDAVLQARYARAALAVWILALTGAIAAGIAGVPAIALALLLPVIVTPTVLSLVLVWRRIVRRQRRIGGGWRRVRAFLGLVFLIACVLLSKDGNPAGAVFLLAGLALLLSVRSTGSQKLRQQVLAAIRDRRYPDAILVGQRNPKKLARDPILRHDVALARALGGDRAAATRELEALSAVKPKRFPMALLTLSLVARELDLEKSLAAARLAEKVLPKDPAAPVLVARTLLRLGRVDEAAAEAARAAVLEPEDGSVIAVLAEVAIARRDSSRARELLEKAERLAPGDATVMEVRALLEIDAGTVDSAAAAVRKVKDVARTNPFALLTERATSLEERLAARIGGARTA